MYLSKNMKLKEIMYSMQNKWEKIDQQEKDDLLSKANDMINSNNYNYSNNDSFMGNKEILRVLFSQLASTEVLQYVSDKSIIDNNHPNLLCNCLLIRASQQNQECKQDLIYITKIILNHKRTVNYNEHEYSDSDYYDEKISLDLPIGYVIGKKIALGHDIEMFLPLCKKPFISNKNVFLKGLEGGVNSILKNNNARHSLLFYKDYIQLLNRKYENWESSISFDICKSQVVFMKEKPNLLAYYPNNEKFIWFLHALYPQSKIIVQLMESYSKYQEQCYPPIIKEVIKEVIVEIPESPSYKTAIELTKSAQFIHQQLSNEISKQQDKIDNLGKVERKNYKSRL